MKTSTEILYTRKYKDGACNLLKPEAFPLYAATAFTANTLTEIKQAYAQGYTYIRTNNPDRDVLASQVTALEAPGLDRDSLIFSSGMASISTTIGSLLQSGDHVICNRNIYGETFDVFGKMFSRFGIESTLVDMGDIENIKAAIKPNTKLIYSEVCANPTMNLIDIPEVAKLAHDNGALLMMDNTFTTAVSIKPLTLGADIVISSVTKFMNGHSDVVLGCMTSTHEIIETVRPMRMLFGTPADPFPCWQAIRGFETMFLRVEKQLYNAAKLAAFFESDPHIIKVNHPSVDSFPQRELAKKLWPAGDEHMTGMMSIILNTEDEAKIDEFMAKLEFVHYATTLGGLRTTLNHPCTSSHSHMPDADRRKMGITPGMFRVSVGIEDTEDLINDFKQALAVLD
ncbi:MAG: aminotransferase class I/II-fold pyridoxal phosphate-dependent enzyme [Clostridiales bacterium]|nr:aminotransferase class I/II-fold pyridoxal phosphate-dependent enzyme [Clostridiales bacterium]